MVMTIDEIKVRLINLMKPIRINLMDTEIEVRREEYYLYLKPIFEALECTIDCLEELQWYREQDLVMREAVSRIISTCEDECKYDNCLDCGMMRLYEIPKAEPPKMRDGWYSRSSSK